MKVALVIFNADPSNGGAETYTADLAAALALRGHSVKLLATQFGPPISGVNFVTIHASRVSRAGTYRQFVSETAKYLDEHQHDVVHAMLPIEKCDVYHPHAGLAREMINRKWLNRLNTKRMEFVRLEQSLIEKQNPVVLCLSDYVKKTMLSCYPNARMTKLFNAVDLQKFDPSQHPEAREGIRKQFKLENKIVALMIAQDFERKGLKQTIEAIANLKNPNLSLLVVGRDNPKPYIKQAVSCGVASQIIFAGPTDQSRDFYQAADFFVLPTRHDPCSLVVLESLAMGLPVISTVFNGACEIMQSSKHGFVLEKPDDVGALSNAMSRLTEESIRKSANQACLALRPMLSFENHLEQLEAVYARLQ